MKVTVIIPTYNRAHLVTDAIESVFAQTFKDYEIIVIDDGSTDGTAELIASRGDGRLRYLYKENGGISSARNRGITEARGKYVAFLDSDDIWLPEKLAKQVAYMEANSQLGFSCTKFRAYSINTVGSKQYAVSSKVPPAVCQLPTDAPAYRYGPAGFSNKFSDLLVSKNFIPTSTVMVRRDCFDEVGIYDESIPCYEDFDLWLRLAKRYSYDLLDELLVEYREHPQNTSKNDGMVHEGLWRLYSKILDTYSADITDLKAFERKTAAYQYLVGAERFKSGQVREALRLIAGALRRRYDLGLYFAEKQACPACGLFMMLKPYLALLVCCIGFCFGRKARSL